MAVRAGKPIHKNDKGRGSEEQLRKDFRNVAMIDWDEDFDPDKFKRDKGI